MRRVVLAGVGVDRVVACALIPGVVVDELPPEVEADVVGEPVVHGDLGGVLHEVCVAALVVAHAHPADDPRSLIQPVLDIRLDVHQSRILERRHLIRPTRDVAGADAPLLVHAQPIGEWAVLRAIGAPEHRAVVEHSAPSRIQVLQQVRAQRRAEHQRVSGQPAHRQVTVLLLAVGQVPHRPAALVLPQPEVRVQVYRARRLPLNAQAHGTVGVFVLLLIVLVLRHGIAEAQRPRQCRLRAPLQPAAPATAASAVVRAASVEPARHGADGLRLRPVEVQAQRVGRLPARARLQRVGAAPLIVVAACRFARAEVRREGEARAGRP